MHEHEKSNPQLQKFYSIISSCSLNQDIIFTMTAVSKSLHFSKRVSTIDAFRFIGQQSNFDSRKGNSGKPYIRTIVCTLSDAFGN